MYDMKNVLYKYGIIIIIIIIIIINRQNNGSVFDKNNMKI